MVVGTDRDEPSEERRPAERKEQPDDATITPADDVNGAADVLDERDRLVVAGRSTLSALRWLLCLQSAMESSVPGYS